MVGFIVWLIGWLCVVCLGGCLVVGLLCWLVGFLLGWLCIWFGDFELFVVAWLVVLSLFVVVGGVCLVGVLFA